MDLVKILLLTVYCGVARLHSAYVGHIDASFAAMLNNVGVVYKVIHSYKLLIFIQII